MLKKFAALSIFAFIMFFEPLWAIAQQTAPQPPQGYYGLGPWHMWNEGYGWHFWWMFPMMILFFLFVCGVVLLFTRGLSGHGLHCWRPPTHTINRPLGDPTYSALEILNEHFARGEIQKDEYTEKKAAILSDGRT